MARWACWCCAVLFGTQIVHGVSLAPSEKKSSFFKIVRSEKNGPALQSQARVAHFIYTVGCNQYQLIQAVALDHSWKKVGNTGKLTRIVNGCANTTNRHLLEMSPLSGDPAFKVFFADGKADLTAMPTHKQTSYPARARPHTIETWLQQEKLVEDVVVILDPDMVWLRPLSEHSGLANVRPGLMLAQKYDQGASWIHFKEAGEIMPAVSTEDAVSVYATGPPWAVDISDLRRMLPEWKRYTDVQKGDALMREQNAFNMAALKQNIPSTGDTDMMISDKDAPGEAWDNDHPEPWKPYILHYDGSYKYGIWELHKTLASNGWYAQKFDNSLPTVIQCGGPVLEEPPWPPTKVEEPDVKKRRDAFMIGNVISSLKKAAMAYRVKYCDKDDESKLGLVRVMQPGCEMNTRTRYLVERPSESWTEHYPLGGDRCSNLAQGVLEHQPVN